MKLYAASTLLFDYPITKVIPMAREIGYDGVELWHFHQKRYNENITSLAKLAQETDTLLSVHALSWDLNYCSRLPEIREASLVALEESISITRDLGAGTVVVHPGRITIPLEPPEANWPLLIEGTQRLADYADKVGVVLSLEIMEHIPREFFINPSDAQYLLDHMSSSSMTITMDAAHVPFSQDLIDYFSAIPQLGHIHISDSTPQKLHLPLGKGERDFPSFLSFLKNSHDQLPVVIEGLEFSHTDQLAVSNKRQFDNWMKNID